MNICRTQFKSQITIIEDTFIEAFSLFRYFNNNYLKYIPDEIKGIICEGLTKLKEQIRLSSELFIDGEKKFCKSDSIDYELRQSEYAFSLILADYITSMQRMEKSVGSILELYI